MQLSNRSLVLAIAGCAVLGAIRLGAMQNQTDRAASGLPSPERRGVDAAPQAGGGPTRTDEEQLAELMDLMQRGTDAALAAGDRLYRRWIPAHVIEADQLRPHFTGEFTRQFRPVLGCELYSVRAVCKPSDEQYAKIKAAGLVGLDTAVQAYVDAQVAMYKTFYVRGRPRPKWPDPRKIVVQAIDDAVSATLSPPQRQAYREVVTKRAAARKRVAAHCMVANIDKEVLLSSEQRAKLIEVVLADWKDGWSDQMESWQYGDRYVPAIDDAKVLPLLTATQQAAWRAIKKREEANWGWTGFAFVQPPETELDIEARKLEPPPIERIER